MNRPGPLVAFWATLLVFGILPTIGNLVLHVLLAWACAFTVYALLEGHAHDHHR